MYNAIKSVISAGGYKLADIQRKVKKLYATNDLTEDQMDELLYMAAGGASPDAERPEVLEMLRRLDERIKALEEKQVDPGDEPEEPAEYEQWQPWDGISNKYQPGSVVIHKGVVYESTYQGRNVWEPGTVDERFWKVKEV